jgi:hypothetical protein
VIEIDREELLACLTRDSELIDILLKAFILRRAEMIARGIGNVVLVGSIIHPAPIASKNSSFATCIRSRSHPSLVPVSPTL